MSKVLEKIMDALDIETFIACNSEEEGEKLALQMMDELGFKDVSIVFIQHQGPGARIRVRGYIYKPGDKYKWLFS